MSLHVHHGRWRRRNVHRGAHHVETLSDELFQETTDTGAMCIAVVLEALISHAFDRDASARLPFCHIESLGDAEASC